MKHENKTIIMFAMAVLLTTTAFAQQTYNLQTFLLNQNPDPAKAGDILELRIRFQNTGGAEAKNIIVEPILEYPFAPLTEEDKQQTIASLPHRPEKESSKTLTFKFRIDRDAPAGQYTLKFRHSTTKGTSWTIKEFSIDMTGKEIAELKIDKTILVPGKETPLTFTIENNGQAPLENLMFSWDEPNNAILPVGSDNTRYVRYVEPGEKIDLTYRAIASLNANPDLYTLNLNLEYDTLDKDGSVIKQKVPTKAGIFVGGPTDFDVTFSESTQGKISLSVANVGTTPALSVTVRVPQQEGLRVMGSSDAIVGNLGKGDYTVVSFQIIPADTETQQQRQRTTNTAGNVLKTIIEYTDTTGERHALEKTVPFQLSRVTTDSTDQQAQWNGRRHQTTSSMLSWKVILLTITLALILFFIEKKRHYKELKFLKTKLLRR